MCNYTYYCDQQNCLCSTHCDTHYRFSCQTDSHICSCQKPPDETDFLPLYIIIPIGIIILFALIGLIIFFKNRRQEALEALDTNPRRSQISERSSLIQPLNDPVSDPLYSEKRTNEVLSQKNSASTRGSYFSSSHISYKSSSIQSEV